MKFNWKAFLGIGKTSKVVNDQKEVDLDQFGDFYYTNLKNSLILFTFGTQQLDAMRSILLDPISELYEELDYAFMPAPFETLFRVGLVDISLREDLQSFKKAVDDIPTEIWSRNFIDTHETWIKIRQQANTLLHKMNVTSREYDDSYTTVFDEQGNILKEAKLTPQAPINKK